MLFMDQFQMSLALIEMQFFSHIRDGLDFREGNEAKREKTTLK